MRRCVIVGGAPITAIDLIAGELRDDDYLIACDCGLRHLEALGRTPDLVVGDFDSHEKPLLSAETIVLPREKDDTDTCYAAKEALRRGFGSFLLLGAVGARLDHSLGNLGVLQLLHDAGAAAKILDDYGEMELVDDREKTVTADYPFFSLLNISGTARHVTVTGAKYPLADAEIPCGTSLGVSNEPLPGQTAHIRVGEGRLLLVRIRKE